MGQLKKEIENLPNNAKVYYQRIEDIYFTKHNWETKKMPNSNFAPEEIDDEYIKCWCRVRYKDDKNLYLTAHY